MAIVPVFAPTASAAPASFAPDPKTSYAQEFIEKCDGQQWFMDTVESVLNISSRSINTLTGRSDLNIITALASDMPTGGGILPRAVGELTRLRYLFLGGLGLEGAIPSELYGCTELENIDLSGNTLTGSLSPDIINLTKLKVLLLHGNGFTGAIPATLPPLLENLDLADNGFTGGFPASVLSLSNLKVLALSNNPLGGVFPTGITVLSKLRILLAWGCGFEGGIPASLGSLPDLEILDVSDNKFTGHAPASLLSLQESGATVSVEHNYLSGPTAASLEHNAGNFASEPSLEYQVRLYMDAYIYGAKGAKLNIYQIFTTVRADSGTEEAKEKLPPSSYELVLLTELDDPGAWLRITQDDDGVYLELLRDIPKSEALALELRMLPYNADAPYTYVRFTAGTESAPGTTPGGGVNTDSGGGFDGGPAIVPPEPPVEAIALDDDGVPKSGAEDHIAYINGYPGGLMMPGSGMTREEAAAMLHRLAGSPETDYDGRYPDVTAERWSSSSIAHVSEFGIMEGYEDGTFRPSGRITRAEFATVLVRLKGIAPSSGVSRFSDASGHWAEGYIVAAESAGLVEGYPDGSFRPNAQITRAEAVTALNRMLGRIPDREHIAELPNPYTDIDANHWAYWHVMEASIDHLAEYEDGIESWL